MDLDAPSTPGVASSPLSDPSPPFATYSAATDEVSCPSLEHNRLMETELPTDAHYALEDGGTEDDQEEDGIAVDVIGEDQCDTNEVVGEEAMSKEVDLSKEKPFVGMKFHSEEELVVFYNSYARKIGFSTRKNKLRRSERTNKPVARKVVCAKEGFKDLKDKRYEGREVKRRPECREGCKAHIYAVVDREGAWVVRSFHKAHNHALATPSKVRRLRSHKSISSSARGLIDTLHSCGLGPSKISSVLSASGEMNVSSQVCRDQIKQNRQNNLGHECMSIVRSFEEKMGGDSDFFFRFEVDETMMVRSVFWADGRSRASYLHFGDVVVFDTTYRTNKFTMPFAPFTGINHHRQSTLFGCALLEDETIETFRWLFRTWLQCMHGKAPTAIITDQDPAMRAAISCEFPQTTHRFCIWHIKKNALIHLHLLRSDREFEHDYHKWIYGSRSVEEFETRWEELKERYNIAEDGWLNNMYKMRAMWVPIYLKHVFFAGMSSTQRSESINAFFDGYVHSQTPLSEFVLQYERAMSARREAEEDADFQAMNTKPVMWCGSKLEIQASNFYTPANFHIFQMEFKKIVKCEGGKVAKDDDVTTYEAYLESFPDRKFLVDFYLREKRFICSCQKFESEGIPCCHVLYLLKKKGIQEIPKDYLLDRWSKDVRFVGLKKHCLQDGQKKPTLNKLWGLQSRFSEMYDWGSRNDVNYEVVLNIAEEGMKRIKELQLNDMTIHSPPNETLPPPTETLPIVGLGEEHITIRDPPCAKAKGRPRNVERIKSGMEVSSSAAEKKERKCGNCGEKGHYRTKCKADVTKQQRSTR